MNFIKNNLNFALGATLFLPFAIAAECGEPKAGAAAKLPPGYVEEAPLPEGVPPPAEVGQVVEKEYPAVRSYSATGNGQFFKCFSYLTLKNHKMTAPVVLEYAPLKRDEKIDPRSADLPASVKRMHFLLQKAALDEPQSLPLVEVADIPKMRVLSIAHQGKLDAKKLAALEAKLFAALQSRPTLSSAGPPRLLGYNSPMVPSEKVYWELQLPVKAAP